MSDGSSSPFREKSLERLSSPERLDQLLTVVDRRSWVPLTALAVIIALLVGWSIAGRVPVHVEGRGILIWPREVISIQAPGAGYLAELMITPGDAVRVGELLGRIERPDLDKQLELERIRLDQLVAQLRATEVLRLGPDGTALAMPELYGATGPLDQLEALRAVAGRLRELERGAVEQERHGLDRQIEVARALVETRSQVYDDQRLLLRQEIVPRTVVIEAQADLVESQAVLANHESALRALVTRELEIEARYLDRLQRVAEREQQIADVRREISRVQHVLLTESRIVSEHEGRVLEIAVSPGEYLQPGERIGALASNAADASLEGLVYFKVRDGKRLETGNAIRITPDTVERERYGSIPGEIVYISELPVTLAEARKMSGSEEIAASLIDAGYRIQVRARLDLDPTTPSGFAWTSSGGPDILVTAGTTATARVAVESRHPITFVLPVLKESMGID